jgi:ABC-2 type transport system ATP-binding protein
MILTEDLTKLFGDFAAVDGVSLKIEAGEVLALLGPNGAGKTTTVRMLTSVLRPSRGWAKVA